MVISVIDELKKYYIFTVPTQDKLGYDYYALKSNKNDYTLEKIPNIIELFNKKNLKVDEIAKEDKNYLDYINGISYVLVKLLKSQKFSLNDSNELIYYANGKINYMQNNRFYEYDRKFRNLIKYKEEETTKATENLVLYMIDQINDYNENLINNKRSK